MDAPDTTAPTNPPDNRSEQRKIQLAFGFITASVLIALVVWFTDSSSPDSPENGRNETAGPTSTTSTTQRRPTDPVEDIDQFHEDVEAGMFNPDDCPDWPAVPESDLTEPPENEWDVVYGLVVPRSAASGPASRTETARACYAPTVEGALFAAVNFPALGFGPDVVEHYERFATGPGAAAAVAQARELVYDPEESADIALCQTAGFRTLTYSPGEEALFEIARRCPSGLQSSSVRLLWQGGDWRLWVSDSDEPGASVIGSLTGYVEWKGV